MGPRKKLSANSDIIQMFIPDKDKMYILGISEGIFCQVHDYLTIMLNT